MKPFRLCLSVPPVPYCAERTYTFVRLCLARAKSGNHCFFRYASHQAEHKHQMPISQCYKLLGVHADCTEEELRIAYLDKVKHYHPDQSTPSADSAKFIQVQQAYKAALDHRRGREILEEQEDNKVDIHDIRHTVPQHRRYLTFDGIGFGSPTDRQRQHKQFRISQATESVYEHRKMQFGSEESAVALKDKAEARKIKISNLIDRVVDDLIRESMQKGEFDNLSGQGKPLDHSDHNPLVDPTTHNLNKIMVNNGFKPEWIMLSKEIRDDISLARKRIALTREKLGPPPYTDQNEMRWNHHTHKFKESLQEINSKINKYNMIVPFMDKQMVHYDYEKILQKVLYNHDQFLPSEDERSAMDISFEGSLSHVSAEDKIKWDHVWSNIKDVFKSR
ncbi:dnaJ homolog subfamily C member 28 [Aplysia californica]|uniref:DnaJ homolog subfamily C member 28 n=1 Tax=Aplysia californica TaxID=6500 RepID=A0ABM0JED1_APLCA|nr:dnaJ homolog subfamily C member 28 [Aplysia californica]XP_005091789.1 dnaJ homolog subfamily C member 28 [Aplysia californica]